MKTKQELFMEEFRKEVRKEKIRQAKEKEKQKNNEFYGYLQRSYKQVRTNSNKSYKNAYFVANNKAKTR